MEFTFFPIDTALQLLRCYLLKRFFLFCFSFFLLVRNTFLLLLRFYVRIFGSTKSSSACIIMEMLFFLAFSLILYSAHVYEDHALSFFSAALI